MRKGFNKGDRQITIEKQRIEFYLHGSIKVSNYANVEIKEAIKTGFQVESFESSRTVVNGPDLYAHLKNGKLLVLEHFEFDSSKRRKRKGSKSKEEISAANRNFDETLESVTEVGESVYNEHIIKSSTSLQCYKNNLIESFERHYKNIDNYIDNIISANLITNKEDILLAFFIEDSTLCGNQYYNADDYESYPLIPLNIPEFIERLKESDKLDYLFIGLNTRKSSELVVIELNEETTDSFSLIPKVNDKYHMFIPLMMGFSRKSTLVGRKKINDNND